MGDRVAIIGGSVSGRDHFPPNVFGISAVTGTHPYWWVFSLTHACHVFYVVKKWHFEVSGQYTLQLPGPTQTSHNFFIGFDFAWNVYNPVTFDDYREPSSEAELVLNRDNTASWALLSSGFATVEDNGQWTISNLEAFNGDNSTGTGMSFDFSMFNTNLKWQAGSFVMESHLNISKNGSNLVAGSGSFTRNVGEFNINLAAIPDSYSMDMLASDYGSAPERHRFISADVSISPIEYWPYAGKDGLPIYDTETGTVLSGRNPLTS